VTRLVAVTLVAGLAAGCRSAPSKYLDFGAPTSRSAPIRPGEVAIIGTSVGEVRVGDTVIFLAAEAVGLTGASALDVEPLLALTSESGSLIGVGAVRDVPPEIAIAAYRPLAGRRVAATDGSFAVALRLTMPDGDVSITGVRVTFRIGDGEPQSQMIPAAARLCPDRGERARCPAPDPPTGPGT
jgi:hypothetical protein